jgi:aminoglycoside phosphotransferase (APT) family kinase protein
MSEGLVDGLIDLHALDYQEVGLGDFGKPDGYVERQVTGWSRRYADCKTDEVPELEALMVWLRERIPRSPAPTVIHNDYKYDNVILDPDDLGTVTTILDWEMATIGDPLMDLGTLLCYWIDAGDLPEMRGQAFGPTAIPGSLTRRDVVARYVAGTGRDLGDIEWYYRFGLFKTAVIVQQIYYRFYKGVTKDTRFSTMNQNAIAMARQAMTGGRQW